MLIAITRAVSPTFNQCELTHLSRQSIDVALAETQHQQYGQCLRQVGYQVQNLPPLPACPDAIFVEDTALVVEELAVILRPGAPSRRAERESIALALDPYRTLHYIEAPGTIDGGDILRLGKTLFVGLSPRTNQAGLAQLQQILEPYHYEVVGVEITDCLHLKSAVTQVGAQTLLLNPGWVDKDIFPEMTIIEVDPTEPGGANALYLGDVVIYPAAFPRTAQRLHQAQLPLQQIDVSEVLKAEGGVTCCSLIFTSST